MQHGRSHLTKLKTAEERVTASKSELLAKTEKFYGQLHISHDVPATHSNDSRASLIHHYTDDILNIHMSEIGIALRQLQNSKAPCEDEITS